MQKGEVLQDTDEVTIKILEALRSIYVYCNSGICATCPYKVKLLNKQNNRIYYKCIFVDGKVPRESPEWLTWITRYEKKFSHRYDRDRYEGTKYLFNKEVIDDAKG